MAMEIKRFRHSIAATPFAIALAIASLIVTSGCTQNPYLAGPGGQQWQGQTAQVNPSEARLSELSRRVQLLDDNNRQLHTQLAQSEQQRQVYQDELTLVRKQLAETTQQFESAKIAANDAQNSVRNFQASTTLRGGATIRPNTNLSQLASRLSLGSIPVRADGEAIRISIPSDHLFQPGTAQIQPQAVSIIDPIAAQLKGVFPQQKIAIEGHTDNAPIFGGQVATSHQLASAQVAAIVDLLTRRSGMPPQQLSIVAQGANVPVQPNGTAAGRAANRRIDFVISPESF